MTDIKVGIKLSADGKAAVISLDQVNAALERTRAASKRLQGDTDRLSAAWAKLSAQGSARWAAIESAKKLTEGLSAAGRAADEARAQAERLGRGVGILSSGFDTGTASFARYAKGLAGVYVAYQAVQRTASMVAERVNVAAQVDRQRVAMDAASSGMRDAADNLRFVQDEAQRLGINLLAAEEGFVGLTAAAKGTELQGQATRGIFSAVAKAAAALGKSSEDTQGILTALGQMISKGTVQMEELRGQLGDRLPGAFQVAARAMGLTTAELDKLISSGQVTAAEFLPKLAQALDETYGNARFDRINNNIQRLDNAWTKLKANMVDTQSMSSGIGMLAGLFDRLNAMVEKSKGYGTTTAEFLSKSSVARGLAGGNAGWETTTVDAVTQRADAAAEALKNLGAVQRQVYEEAKRQSVDPAFALAIANQESRFKQAARSPRGAMGVMQLMPGTARGLGVDPAKLEDNIKGGVAYLKQMLSMFHGDLRLAAAAYNAGPNRQSLKAGRVPAIQETQDYVKAVAAYYDQWKQQMGGGLTPFADPKDLQKDADNFYRVLSQAIEQRAQLEDAAGKTRVAQQQAELARLKQAAADAAKNSEIQIKTVVDTQGLDAARQAIDQAEAKQADFLRQMNALAGGKDSAAVAAAERQVQAMDAMIAKARELGQWDEQGAKLTQDRALAEEHLKQARIEAGGQTLAMEQALADNHAKYQALRESANQDDLAYQRQSAEYRQQLLAAEAEGRKAAIDGAVEQLKTESAVAEAQRAQQAEQLTGLAAVQAARANIQVTLQEQLAIAEAEKNAALAKLDIDYQTLESQAAMLTAQQATTASRADLLAIEEKLAAVRANQDENLRAQLDAMDALTAKQAKLKTEAAAKVQVLDVQQVKEAQLEMNAFWDQTIQRFERLSTAWSELTDGQSKGIDRMLVGLAQYGKSVDQIASKYEELARKGEDIDPLGQTQFSETAKATAQAIGETTLGLRTMFQIGSDGYRAMTAGATLALAAQDLLNISDSVGAVLKQLKEGDPYTASARAAIVAAQVAALGLHIAGGIAGMGRGSSNRAAEQQAKTGTGTVLGDASAQSQSISRSIDLIAQNTSSDLSYSAKMLQALQNIESALSGASSLIFQSVLPSIKSDIANSGLDFGMKKISLFSGFDKEVTDYGLGQVAAQSLKSILQEGFKTLAKYADITDSFKVLGMELSSSTDTYIRDLDAGVTGQFNRIIKGMVDALREGGEAFGLSSDDFNARLAKFKVDIGKISLKDLSSEEAKRQIEAAFSKVFDEMASTLAVGLRPFKRGGEGAAETYFRVAEGIQRATGELEQIGIQAISYRDILEKQGDVYTEIVRQSVTAQGRLVAGTQEMVAEFNAAQGDIKDFYLALVQAQDLLAAGFNVQDLDRTMINAAGGLDAFVSAMQSFNDSYLSQTDNIAGQLAGLSAQFVQLGQSLPDSKDAFLALMQSIDTSTEAGKKLWGALLQLADGFGQVQDKIQGIKDKYADILNPFGKIGAQLTGVGDDFGTLIADAAAKSQSAIDAFRKTRDDQVDAFTKQLSDTADMRDELTIDRNKAIARRAAAQKIIDEEMAKAPKQRNTKRLNQARSDFNRADEAVRTLTGFIESSNKEIAGFMAAIDKANADFNAASGEEQAKLATERGKILSDAQTVMFSTVSEIIEGLAQTIQEAQQRLDNVLSFQNGLATQIAQLQGSQATADLANARYGQANTAVNDYIGAVTAGGRARDTDEELRLLGNLQTAVMDRYNAEMTLIQEGIQAQTDALNAALQLEIDGINAATQARVEAVNAALEAELDAINAAGETQIKAQQKADQAAIKAIQKQNDIAVKAAQKANDAVIKAQQKVYDAQVKALQKQQEAEVKALQKQQEAEAQVWQDQLDAANTLRDAIKSIQEYAKSLLLGPNSVASPEQRLAEAQRQYQELATKARGGDADALAKLPGSSDAYLEAAKQHYGSGSQYQSIFDGVKTAMEGLGAMSAPDPASIQSHIDRLRESQEAQLDALRESQAEAVDALREQQGEQLDALRETLNEQIDLMREQQAEALDVVREQQAATIDAMREATQAQIEAARKAAQDQVDAIQKDGEAQIKAAQERTAQAIADLSDPNKNTAMKALKDETLQKLQEIHELSEKTRAEAERKAEEARRSAAQQAADAIQIAKDQLARLDSGLTFSAAQIRALNGLMAGLNINHQEPVPTTLAGGSGLEGVAGFANGGHPPIGSPVWIGERGRELVEFDRPAQVISNDRIQGAVNTGNAQVVAAIVELRQEIAALSAEARASVTVQSSAFPQVIDKLSALDDKAHAMWRDQKAANGGPKRRAPA